jgi:hypothetical protein
MTVFMFNDMSLERYYNNTDVFKNSLEEFLHFYTIGKQYGYTIYIYKNGLMDILVCDVPFRKAINDTKYISVEQKRKILNILDKTTPVLPDDSAIPSDLTFFYNENLIPNTGLAECAYQKMMGESASLYSLSTSSFRYDSLTVYIKQNDIIDNKQEVKNYFSIAALEQELQSACKPIQSWDEFFDFVTNNFIWLKLTDDAKKYLKREAFEKILANSIITRLDILNKMAESESEKIFLELYRKHCQGNRAWFSDESLNRKQDPVLNEKLTFLINGKHILCNFHGKINYRDFRIHISSQPKRHEKLYIAYIGRKIL